MAGRPIVAELIANGIPVKTERHASGNGIMHLKGSPAKTPMRSAVTTARSRRRMRMTNCSRSARHRNWCRPTTRISRNCSINTRRPIPRRPTLKRPGHSILLKHPNMSGQTARVRGTLVNAHSSASGTVFLDFYRQYRSCPFSDAIFADDAKQFGDFRNSPARKLSYRARFCPIGRGPKSF
jgi:hypothetical protein